MSAIAYLKQQCGWSRGVREVLAKCGIDFEERQIHIAENFEEMERVFGFLHTRLGFYNSLTSNEKLVLRTNVQGQFNFGNRFDFYQAVT